MINKNDDIKRYLIKLDGIVQGVGFRPYVYQKAKEYHVFGWVNNEGASLVIDAEGNREVLKHFILDIIKQPPTLASVEKTEIRQQDYIGYKQFEIIQSSVKSSIMRLVSPDMGVCDKCIEEVFDPHSRRYRYAFTNCTECGPRYSIIESLPYDRCNTTMKNFIMCRECDDEYHNPESRRFHTQPNCCSNCGPALLLVDRCGEKIKSLDCIKKTAELIKSGSIIAIKGIGGFHLCCDAQNEEAVAKLRRRKNRPDKPLAVMMKNIDVVNRYCELTEKEINIITNQRKPIVLLKKKKEYNLSHNIAPCQKRLGVMLPYVPVHYLLFEEGIDVIVMTSGNMSGAPIEYENQNAVLHLNQVADYFLLHDRNINNPVDDSVVKVAVNKEMVSRRARGYTPYAQNLGIIHEIFALGGEQKSTFCMSQNRYAYMSQYLGDLKYMDSYKLYKQMIDNFSHLLQSDFNVYAHDLHPVYLSTGYAGAQQGIKVAVQHHHAHMASCMAEHKLHEKVIGVIFDGTGLGTDGSIWGGEFLVGDRRNFERAGHLKPVLLQGGDTVVKEPWKTAVSYLFSLGYDAKDYLKTVDKSDIEIIEQALSSNLNCNVSSSMGRFFDCIAALVGVREHVTYDAQAAIELEGILDSAVDTCYDYSIKNNHKAFELDYEKIILGVIKDIEQNVSPKVISARFHNTISNAASDVVCRIGEKFNLNHVVLSGGVFENIYLLEGIYEKLRKKGFHVFFNEQIPINDSGISVGQLVIADKNMKE